MKTCTKCQEEKPLEDFRVKSKSIDGRQSACRQCSKIQEKAKQAIKTREEKDHTNKLAYLRTTRNRQYVFDYLRGHHCIDCGESDPIVLEFDHRDGTDKLESVSEICYFSSLDKVKLEIDKCDVRCANCHRRRTAKQFNWYKGIIIESVL